MIKSTQLRFFLAAICLLSSTTLFAQTNYYPNSAGANQLDSLASWGTNPDGTGTAPTSFIAANQIFNISNSTGITSFATGGAWMVSGSGSEIVVPANDTLIVNGILTVGASADINAGLKVDGVIAGDTLRVVGSSNATVSNWFLVSGGTSTVPGQINTSNTNIPYNDDASVVAGSYLDVNSAKLAIGGGDVLRNFGNLNSNVLALGASQCRFYNETGATFVCTGMTFSGLNSEAVNSGDMVCTGILDNSSSLFTNNGTLLVSGQLINDGADFINTGTVTASDSIYIDSGDEFINNGIVYATGSDGIIGRSSTSKWTNGASSLLEVHGQLLQTGTLTASATGNTVIYESNVNAQDIKGATYYNLIVSKTNSPSQAQVASLLGNVTTTNITIDSGIVDASSSNYGITVKGEWVNRNLFIPRSGTVTFNGTVDQHVTHTTAEEFYNVTVNKTGGQLILNDAIKIDNNLQLTGGYIVSSDTAMVLMQAAGTSAGASVSSFVVGPVSKIGTTDFVFPVGKDSAYRPIGVSNLTAAETFVAEYQNADPNTTYSTSQKDASLITVSNCEYWTLMRTGAATANVTLSWDSVDNCGFTDAAMLVVAGWDGSIWKDYQRNSSVVPGPTAMITSNVQPSNYSAFTLASSTFDAVNEPAQNSIAGLSVFPNPASSSTLLQYSSKSSSAYTIQITDITGKIVLSQQGISSNGLNQLSLDLSSIQSGLYIVTLKSENDSQKVRLTIE